MALVTLPGHILYEYCVPHARVRKEEKVDERRDRNITQPNKQHREQQQHKLVCSVACHTGRCFIVLQFPFFGIVCVCVILAWKLQLSQTPRVSGLEL